MRILFRVLRRWLPLAAAIVAACGLVYVTAQQILRQSANDPQIQLAEDTAASLAAGRAISALIPSDTVEISHSVAPFLLAYDDTGQIRAASGVLNGALPEIPMGVLETARRRENRVTWQPQRGVRIAAVVVHYSGAASGYVLAGRSLREVERRDNQLLAISTLACAVTLGASLLITIVAELLFAERD